MKKNRLYLAIFILGGFAANAQGVGIGTPTPASSAILELSSTSKGFLLPRMTSANRAAIADPIAGLQVFDTNTNSVWAFDGTNWNTQDVRLQGTRNHYSFDAGLTSTGGTDNIGLGNNALAVNSSNNNVAVGGDALAVNTGSGNVAIGRYALYTNTTGVQNTTIGTNAGNTITTGNRNIAVGNNAQVPDPAAVGQLSIGNAIFGTGLTGTVAAPAGNIGIGTSTPASKLEVNGASTNTVAYNAGSGRTIDYSQSNLAYTTATAGAFTLNNLKNGGTYSLAVRGTTSATSTFTAAGFTVKYANNRATTNGTETVYTFLVMGTTVYVYMSAGF